MTNQVNNDYCGNLDCLTFISRNENVRLKALTVKLKREKERLEDKLNRSVFYD